MKRPRRAGNDGGEGVGGEVVAPRGAKPGRGDDLLEEGGGWRGNSVIHSTIAGPVGHVGYWSVLLTVAAAERPADPSCYLISGVYTPGPYESGAQAWPRGTVTG